ncbi:MAG: hydantoin racemase [Rhizobiales bacterium PAR1]|nr:MAG: hydantoin racemase [Rhizobiales bacterium PAR1]
MKLLLINGNMTQAVTDTVVAEACRVAAPGTEIAGVTATFGANIVTREAENVIAGHAVLDLLARHHAGFDAVILAISFDTALEAARQISPIPVLGMTDSALIAASEGGGMVGVILFGGVSRPLYEALFAQLPAGKAVAAIRVIEIASVAAYLDTGALENAILAEVSALAATGIHAVVICGAAMAGIAERLQPRSPSRLFDGIPCAIRRAEALVQAGCVIPQSIGERVQAVTVSGLSPELSRLMCDPQS